MSANSKKYKPLCKNLGYEFKDYALLELALTHRSYATKNNERLEFLGDSLVNLFMGEALFLKFPNIKEGQLSRMRAGLVKGETLAQIALQLGLDGFLKLGTGELKAGGDKRQSTLADSVEAVIAAIYLDSDFITTKTCVSKWFEKQLGVLGESVSAKDNKSKLQEFMQAKKKPLPRYEVVEISGKAHEQTFKVQCHLALENAKSFFGTAKSKRLAEQIAAQRALEELNIK